MRYIIVAVFLFIGVVESIRHRKLTPSAAIAGGIAGFCIFIGGGWMGLAMLCLFFLLGTIATSWKRKQKAVIGMAQERGGQRKIGQVLANAGVAALLGLLTLFFPSHQPVFAFLMAGAFSAAMADTLSSELGSVYGKNFYNISTFKKDRNGLDGVVSLEGTAIGILGSCVMAAIYVVGAGWSHAFLYIVLAGTIGNIVDSLLGALLERKGFLTNDVVNLLNTLTGALVLLLFL